MREVLVRSIKAQMKIQEMAFMLVAVMIFFGMVALVYFSITLANVRSQAASLGDQEAQALARQMATTPELGLASSTDCANCVDMEKAFAFKDQTDIYKKLWNIDYLMLERVYPASDEKICAAAFEYREQKCNQLVLIGSQPYATKTAFVALAIWDPSLRNGNGGWKYELGKVHVSPKRI